MTTSSSPSRLFERYREMDLLRQAWQAATEGRGSLWFVCAEAGGGKTRLAQEVIRLTDARALWGAAEPLAPPDPYVAILQILPGFQPAPTRAESVARALALLRDEAGDEPVIIMLDDLHFADEGTIAVVVRIAMECAQRPWLALAAFRPGEGVPGLHSAVVELVAQQRARRLELAPLSREAVEGLVRAVRRHATVADVEAIVADSGGNPWLVEALAWGGEAIAVARDRILLRLERVEQAVPGANAVMAALAPATRPLPHAVVARLCGGDGPLLRTVLSRLRALGLLRSQDGKWGFHHELMRRSLLDAMLDVDRQDAHRALAEALEEHGSAAELSMHYALAGDGRAVSWTLRAAREAAAIGAHEESLAQLERALGFDMAPEERRTALRAASLEAARLGRYRDSRRFAEEGLALPGGVPEVRSLLHQRAADAARLSGDGAAAIAHMNAAEEVLVGQPPSFQMGFLAAGRVLQAAVSLEPGAVEAAVARAMDIIHRLTDQVIARRLEIEVKAFQMVSLLDCGDPAGFDLLGEVQHYAASFARPAPEVASTLLHGYSGAVVSLFTAQASDLGARCDAFMRQHELGGLARLGPYQVLDLVQRGRYAEARALDQTIEPPADGTMEQAVLACARALCEARAGALDAVVAALAGVESITGFRARGLIDLVRLELAAAQGDPCLRERAGEVYEQAEHRRYARVAGAAAVAQARSGAPAPPIPAWLAGGAPVRVLWEWARSVAEGDRAALCTVSERLSDLQCPFEAAIALRDAGHDAQAYRALTAIGATAAREQTAAALRAAGRPIPRRTRSAAERDGLTPMEREVARLVAGGAKNDEIAAALGISPRTVESHLGRIYAKMGRPGRVALATWWHGVAGGEGA